MPVFSVQFSDETIEIEARSKIDALFDAEQLHPDQTVEAIR